MILASLLSRAMREITSPSPLPSLNGRTSEGRAAKSRVHCVTTALLLNNYSRVFHQTCVP